MIVVRTKEELQEAIKNKVDSIRIEDPYAKTFANAVRSRRRKAKVAKGAIGFGALAVIGGLAAAPFTGGASLAGCNSYGTYRWYCNYKYGRISNDSWFCCLCSQQEIYHKDR